MEGSTDSVPFFSLQNNSYIISDPSSLSHLPKKKPINVPMTQLQSKIEEIKSTFFSRGKKSETFHFESESKENKKKMNLKNNIYNLHYDLSLNSTSRKNENFSENIEKSLNDINKNEKTLLELGVSEKKEKNFLDYTSKEKNVFDSVRKEKKERLLFQHSLDNKRDKNLDRFKINRINEIALNLKKRIKDKKPSPNEKIEQTFKTFKNLKTFIDLKELLKEMNIAEDQGFKKMVKEVVGELKLTKKEKPIFKQEKNEQSLDIKGLKELREKIASHHLASSSALSLVLIGYLSSSLPSDPYFENLNKNFVEETTKKIELSKAEIEVLQDIQEISEQMSNMGLSLEDFEGDKKNYFESYKQKADALFKFIKNASIKIFRDQCSKKENMEMISLDKNDYKTILEKKTKLLTNNVSNVKNIKLKLQNIEEKEKFIKKNTFVIKDDHLFSKKQVSKDNKKNEKIIMKNISDISKFSYFDNQLTILPRERSQSTFFHTNNIDLNLKKTHFNLKRSSVHLNLPFLPLKNNDEKRRSVSFAEKPVVINKIDPNVKESIFLTERKNDNDTFQAKKPFTDRRSILVNLNDSRRMSETEKKSELKTSINSKPVFFLNSDKISDLNINSARKSVLFSNDIMLSERKLNSSNRKSMIYELGDKNSSLETSKNSIVPENKIFELSNKNYSTTNRRTSSVITREKNINTSFLFDNEREKNQKEKRIRLESKIKEFDDLTQNAIKKEGKVKRAIRGNSYGKMGPVKDILVFDTKNLRKFEEICKNITERTNAMNQCQFLLNDIARFEKNFEKTKKFCSKKFDVVEESLRLLSEKQEKEVVIGIRDIKIDEYVQRRNAWYKKKINKNMKKTLRLVIEQKE